MNSYREERVSLYRQLGNEGAAPSFRFLDERRARVACNEYNCDACNRPISEGSRYDRLVYLLDGDFQIARYHSPSYDGLCARFVDYVYQSVGDDRAREHAP